VNHQNKLHVSFARKSLKFLTMALNGQGLSWDAPPIDDGQIQLEEERESGFVLDQDRRRRSRFSIFSRLRCDASAQKGRTIFLYV
jgi:hypothetical protein